MARIPATGGCLCGAVRYKATAEPVALSRCHCESCRKSAGATAVTWTVFPVESLSFTRGEPSWFKSSPGVTRGFCNLCGTNLTYSHEDRPAMIDVTTGSLDRPDDFPPAKEIWLSEKVSWETVNAALPHFPQSSAKKCS